jgi:hypothetical protein
MLAELFMLRMESIARSINPRGANNSDIRFVPIKLPRQLQRTPPRRLPRTVEPRSYAKSRGLGTCRRCGERRWPESLS